MKLANKIIRREFDIYSEINDFLEELEKIKNKYINKNYPNGIIGIVDRVSQHFSSVISVLHRQSMVSVSLASTGHSGSLIWPGVRCDEALLVDIPSHVDVKVGDRVVTSGLSVVYPGGIPVGFVSEISGKDDDFYRLTIHFSEDYRCIDRVYVVKNLYKEDIEACR